jgi:hypothetical protein
MAAASGMYGVTLRDVFDATALDVDIDNDSFKLALVTDTYTPDFNAHDFYADITNEIAAGGGYTSGGEVTAGETIAVAGGFVTIDFNDVPWAAATFSAVRAGIWYDDTLASDPLIVSSNFGADFSVTAGTLTVVIHANGFARFDIVP